MEAVPENTTEQLKDILSEVFNKPEQGPARKLPTREIITILAAAAMCIGKHPIQVRDEIPEIRTAALELADSLVD